MNAMRESGLRSPTYAAVWRGEPPWSAVHAVWNRLADGKRSPLAIYQSPSYFEFLESVEGRDELDLLTVRTPATHGVVGVSPVQKLLLDIPFSIGRRTVLKPHISCLRVLGSEPLIPKTLQAHDQLFSLIIEQYPEASVVEMDAVSVDSFLWHYIFSSQFIRENYVAHVLHGVQPCHFIHLPATIDDYRRRLGRKHRHNLERQQRVLERHLDGKLALTLLNREEHVPIVIEAMRELGGLGSDPAATTRKITAAARKGFYQCFLLRSENRIVGMTYGYKSHETFRIHGILYDKTLSRFSPGTTMWHLVMRRLIEDGIFKSLDMGYGTPAYPHRNINTVHDRGKVLLFRKTMANRLLIGAHSAFSALARFSKRALHSLDALKQRRTARSWRTRCDTAGDAGSCTGSATRMPRIHPLPRA